MLVVDAQATPAMAEDVVGAHPRRNRQAGPPRRADHYHAVRVLGASAYRGAEIIASAVTRDMIVERGQQDMDSEIGRFPRLFRGKESHSRPHLADPHVREPRMTLFLGQREVQIIHIGRVAYGGGHGRLAAQGARAVCRRHD